MPSLSTAITIDGSYPAIIADHRTLQGTIAWQKANSIFCPAGPAPLRAWVLMLKRDLTTFLATSGVNGPHTIRWSNILDGVTTDYDFHKLYFSQSERIFQGGVDDENALHLVEFFDVRGILATMTDTDNTRVNVRSYADPNDYLAGTEGGTWTSLVTTLWGKCPGLGAFPGLPYAPDGVPTDARFLGVNAWHALCAVLDKLDCAVSYAPLAGLYEIVRLGATQNLITPTGNMLKWDGEPKNTAVKDIPETVRVYFNNHWQSYGQERDTEQTDNWSVSSVEPAARAYVDVATGVAGALAGTIKAVWDDLPRLLDEDNAISNAAAVTTRAAARAANWVQRQQVVNAHKIYIGIQNFAPGEQIRAVLWRNYGDGEANVLGGTVTEYIAKPELVYGISDAGMGAAAFLSDTSHENYKPLDLARKSYPNFPRLPNIVQVYHSGSGSGEFVDANADGFHPGRVRRWVANNLEVLEDCWIKFVDDHATLGGDVPATNGDCYGPARLSGVSTSGGNLLPVYTVRRGAIVAWVEFTLTADMTAGVSAAATVDRYWDVNPGAAVDINDRQGLFTRALTGAKGIAVLDTINNLYITVECQSKAGWIRGTLTADMSAGSSGGANVVDFGGSQQDVQSPGSTVTVYDPAGLFTHAKNGAAFKAIYDAIEDKYILAECQSKAGWIRGALTADMASSSAAASVTDYGGSQQDVQDPGSTLTVYDPQNLFARAKDTAKFYAVYDAVEDKYNLVECQQQATRIRGDIPSSLSPCGMLFATASITVASADVDVISPVPFDQPTTGNLTIYNVFGWSADVGARFHAEWNTTDSQWQMYQCAARCEDPEGC